MNQHHITTDAGFWLNGYKAVCVWRNATANANAKLACMIDIADPRKSMMSVAAGFKQHDTRDQAVAYAVSNIANDDERESVVSAIADVLGGELRNRANTK